MKMKFRKVIYWQGEHTKTASTDPHYVLRNEAVDTMLRKFEGTDMERFIDKGMATALIDNADAVLEVLQQYVSVRAHLTEVGTLPDTDE
jgi:hypothetical protein